MRDLRSTIGEMLCKLRGGTSLSRVSRDTGIQDRYLSRIEKGQANVTAKTIQRLAEYFAVEPVVLFGYDPKPRPIIEHRLVISEKPLYGENTENFVPVPLLADPASLGAGLEIAEADIQGACLIHRRVLRSIGRPYCIFVQGDSMSPVLENGDMVAVDVSRKDPKKLNRRIVACHTGDFQVTVKRLLLVEGRFHFQAVNPRWEEEHAPLITAQKDGLILGQVVWAWKKFD